MKAIHLRTEYMEDPIGLGIERPRFSWNCEGGVKQSAYRIEAKRDGKIIWDSGKVESGSMTHIPYAGEMLKSRDLVDYTVTLWDENKNAGKESHGFFEMGLLHAGDWRAKWISGDYKPQKNHRYPVDCFRKEFSAEKKIRKARLYVTACGLYQVKINGKRVGEFQLAPGSTDYRKRIQYQTYDVTKQLFAKNIMEVWLADGWYRGSVGCFGQTNVFGRQTKLLIQLEITYEDGSKGMIISDDSWNWSNDGRIRFADLKDGEVIDASLIPSYGKKAILADTKNIPIPTASDNVYPKAKEHFKARQLATPSGDKLLDFGQNLAGFLSFRIKGQKGQRIKILLGEVLDENGEFSKKNLYSTVKPVKEFGPMTELKLVLGQEKSLKCELQPTPRQEIIFFCSGEEDFYQTTFSVFGFRYALVETNVDIRPEDFESVAVYSDMEQTGEFHCSNGLIEKLYENTLWSMKSNFLDVPTDCPKRERLGWTGDAQIFFQTGAYMMNTAPFFRKWLRDLRDNQLKSGKLSAVAPYNGLAMLYDNTGESAGWSSAAILIPYRYWKCFGDRQILVDCYDMMRHYGMFMIANTGHKDKKKAKENPYNRYVYEKGHHLGEWLEPLEFKDMENGAGAKLVPQTEVATAYLHYTMECMCEIAEELGKKEDAEIFSEYARGSLKAYQYLFVSKGVPKTNRQSVYVRPLAFGLIDEKNLPKWESALAAAVQARDYKIGTGFLSTPFVLDVLTGAGYPDMAYKMLENEACPGWLYPITKGATTMWEEWEGSEIASFNHYAYGAVCAWLFDTILGIRVSGKNHFVISPIPGGTLTEAWGSYQSIYGRVSSAWKKQGERIIYTVTIPANCTAQFCYRSGRVEQLSAGTYTLEEGSGTNMSIASC